MLWFKRKPINRRLGRQFVLDVKLRSSKVRAARAKMAAVGLGTCFAIVLGGYSSWRLLEWVVDKYIYNNQAFAIQEIDIQTDGVISVDQLKRWTGVKLEENLLALDLARVERNLKLVPIVESVAIERVRPNTLRVRVFEREPMAQVNLTKPKAGGGIDLAVLHLDVKGYVMLPLQDAQRTVPAGQQIELLPIVSGIKPHEAQPGRRLESPQVQAALRLITAFERSPMAGLADLKRIDVSSPDVLQVTTGQGSEITFSLNDHEWQIGRWREIFEAAQRAGKLIASLDLAVTNNIPARWVDVGPTPPPAPRPVRIPNPRRKHV